MRLSLASYLIIVGFFSFHAASAFAQPKIAQLEPSKTLSLPSSSEPDDNQLKIASSSDGSVIYVIGHIALGSYRKFRRISLSLPNLKTVYLASPGGNVMEGYLIGTILRERKLNTYVEYDCASSCTQIFVAGVERSVGPSARLGFHEAYGEDANGKTIGDYSDNGKLNTLMLGSYKRSGVSQDFAEQGLKTRYDKMWYPNLDQMKKAKFVTRSALAEEMKVPFKVGLSQSEIEAALSKDEFWDILKVRRNALYLKTVDKLWRHGQAGGQFDDISKDSYANIEDDIYADMANANDEVANDMFILWRDVLGYDQKATACYRLEESDELKKQFFTARRTVFVKHLNAPAPVKPYDLEKHKAKIFIYMQKAHASFPKPILPETATPSDKLKAEQLHMCKIVNSLYLEMGRQTLTKRSQWVRATLSNYFKDTEDGE
jgi:hypothetical protein